MKRMDPTEANGGRVYRQEARAAQAQATADRIVSAFVEALRTRRFSEITLDEVAAEAGVTRQTVMRRFESKLGLMRAAGQAIGEQVRGTRPPRATATPGEAMEMLIRDYEATGDLVVNVLAEEDRSPELSEVLNVGRAGHLRWVRETFSAQFRALPGAVRRRRTSQLAVMTDVWVWRVLRRDQKRSAKEVTLLMTEMVEKLLEGEDGRARCVSAKSMKEGEER